MVMAEQRLCVYEISSTEMGWDQQSSSRGKQVSDDVLSIYISAL